MNKHLEKVILIGRRVDRKPVDDVFKKETREKFDLDRIQNPHGFAITRVITRRGGGDWILGHSINLFFVYYNGESES